MKNLYLKKVGCFNFFSLYIKMSDETNNYSYI